MEFVTVSYSKDDLLNQIGTVGHFFTQVLSNFQIGDDDMNLDVDNTKITIRNYDKGMLYITLLVFQCNPILCVTYEMTRDSTFISQLTHSTIFI